MALLADQGSPRYARSHPRPTTQRQHAPKVTNLKVAIHPDYPEQEVSIGGSLSDTGRAAVCALLQRNLDIFAWEPKHMTGVPRSITEHKLKIRQGYSPVRQKKRGQAPERASLLEEVHKLVDAGIMREVFTIGIRAWIQGKFFMDSREVLHAIIIFFISDYYIEPIEFEDSRDVMIQVAFLQEDPIG
ncbi:hypothetical protein Tco_0670314 [Tanacetum coccineum]